MKQKWLEHIFREKMAWLLGYFLTSSRPRVADLVSANYTKCLELSRNWEKLMEHAVGASDGCGAGLEARKTRSRISTLQHPRFPVADHSVLCLPWLSLYHLHGKTKGSAINSMLTKCVKMNSEDLKPVAGWKSSLKTTRLKLSRQLFFSFSILERLSCSPGKLWTN